MTVARITLGGVVLGGSDVYEWEHVVGAAPVEKFLTLTAERAERIPQGQPISYEVVRDGKPTYKVDFLYAIEVLPATNPRQRVVRVVDRRYWWERKLVVGEFNVPVARGNLFLVQTSSTLENALIEPSQEWAKSSLFPVDNGTQRWTARQLIDHVFQKLETPYRYIEDPPIQEIEVFDFALDDEGHTALERVLRYLPGCDVYIDRAGTAVIFNSQPPFSAGTRERGAPVFPYLARRHVTFPGDVQIVNRRFIKPKAVHVYYTPEVEIRYNFSEGSSVTSDGTDLRNIGFVPDFTLTSGSRVYPRGSPLELGTMFSAWGAFGIDPETNAPMEITTSKLRKFALKHGWASFEQMFGNTPLAVPNPVYQQRAAEAIRRWRRTYQIAEDFRDRISSIKAVRVAIINPVTRRRAPSEAYCDWVRRPAMKGFANPGDINQLHGWAVRGYAATLSEAKACPADVQILDPRAGIFDVTPRVDPFGLSQAMILGYPTGGTMPTQGGLADANRTGLDLYAQWDQVELDATFNLSVVLTCTPSSPNDLRKLHKVTVFPGDVGEAAAEGPEWHVRVYPGLLTARFAWTDGGGQELVNVIKGLSNTFPTQLLVNADLVTAVAQATARRIYSRYRDGPAGQAAIDMDPSIEPSGWLSSVRQSAAGGVTETVVQFGGPRRPVDIWPFLSAAHRKWLTQDLEA